MVNKIGKTYTCVVLRRFKNENLRNFLRGRTNGFVEIFHKNYVARIYFNKTG